MDASPRKLRRDRRMKRFAYILFMHCTVCTITAYQCYSQVKQQSMRSAPNIYLDCARCDHGFIRTEITFVNYVRDRKDAQVHVLITTQRTASGGTKYSFDFIGQQNFVGMNDTLTFVSKQTATGDEIRSGVVQTLKMGLMRYVAKTPLVDQIAISYKQQVEPAVVEDKWNNWVFSASVDGFLSGEKSSNFVSLSGSFSASRITLETKARLSASANYERSSFDTEGGTVSTFRRGYTFRALRVESINDHWSAGISASVSSSTFSNTKTALNFSPTFEYNFFRYSESTRRQLRFLYKVGPNVFHYKEETIFNKTSETLFSEELSVTLVVKQPWGSASATLVGSHFFQDVFVDFNKYRAELHGDLFLRLFKGLFLNTSGSVSLIRDQLSLPKRGATPEEILLRRQELATSYYYSVSIGFTYQFGSNYSTIVNPRFGN